MVRAKFYVYSKQVVEYAGGSAPQTQIKLKPVTSGSPENEAFFKATPGGSIDLNIVNEEAAKQLEVGKTYYVDFTQAV